MSWKPGTPLRLASKRFVMRSAEPGDVSNRFMQWQNDAELCIGQNTHPRDRVRTRDQLRKMLSRADNRQLFYLMIGASVAEKPIGYYTVRIDISNLAAETTVVIGDKDFWGKRVVLETRAVLLDFLFGPLGIEKVMGRPHGRNMASIFNYQAQGFSCEAVLRGQLKSVVDGSRLDQLEFGILRDEWRARPESRLS